MGGQDKPLLLWHDQPLVDYVLASVPAWMPKLISANRSIPQYTKRASVVRDITANVPGASGPLVGVLAGLQACQTEWLLVAPGDSPQLTPAWWQHLAAPQTANAAASASQPRVVFDGTRQQHLHMLLPVSCETQLRRYLLQGGYAVHIWLEDMQALPVPFSDATQFGNFNSLDDFACANHNES